MLIHIISKNTFTKLFQIEVKRRKKLCLARERQILVMKNVQVELKVCVFSFQKANINTVKFQFEELVVHQKIDKCIM